ncbi:MAG: 23S rRNA (uracil(1939)-C(5))-methyltransferase RlmD [Pseudomonas sp.]|jgi:23S rRNA (uracil1939-C5)-methyltransferase|nr:23S rRNA (uracil(1939)-C(5))-methyltransferase RlmD [Pseudomonas sp.]MDD2222681.1 23S rRNA (uracil(1939)-C(5))-methyltransferase RlmD [Pseudomonas sp.]MDY0413760.1 23S rRNA (uracil(1939)-C(5))-methyltransferase RlmD [Pseudomonas sp.]NLO53603.1 23S rRNA (uracil(1939)-C(5))-methyltransferase RlmD [Gammaproteobacteria bacterium]
MSRPKAPKTLRFQPAGGESRSLPVGKKQVLNVERLAHDGRGIAFLEGRTWFVSGALPGETVQAQVLSARSKVIEAQTVALQSSSPERITPACQWAGQCGGCTLQHMSHSAQIAFKQANLAEQLGREGVTPVAWAEPLVGPDFAYRRRARVAVRYEVKQKHVEVGFRGLASTAIVEVASCVILVADLQPVFAGLSALFNAFKQPQALGHVELFSGENKALLLRHTQALHADDLQQLRDYCAAQQVQLWLQGIGEPQPDQAGQTLSYSLPQFALEIAYQPGDFVQVNGQMNEAMIAQALDWLAPQADQRVLDLFCGLGNFALPLAKQVEQVIAVEGVESMLVRARANAAVHQLDNVQFFDSDLSQPLHDKEWAKHSFAAALLDPPREGAPVVVERLAKMKVPRILYVSCNPATLARDAALLIARGYRLQKAGILDMFAQTGHTEAMALFVKK